MLQKPFQLLTTEFGTDANQFGACGRADAAVTMNTLLPVILF